MARERQLLLHRKDAHAHAFLALGGRVAGKNERSLREIHFLRDRLHLSVSQSVAIEKDSQRISFQRARREHVPLRHRETSRWLGHGLPRRKADRPLATAAKERKKFQRCGLRLSGCRK